MNLSAYMSVTKKFEFLKMREELSLEGVCVMRFEWGQWCLHLSDKITINSCQTKNWTTKAETVVKEHSHLRSLRKDKFHQKFGLRSEFGRSVRWLLLDLLSVWY